MTTVQSPSLVRRAAAVLLLTAGLVLGAALPSWASFTDAVALPQMRIATPTVAVAGPVTAKTTCTSTVATVTLSWTASAAPRISGYRVRVWLGGAYQEGPTVAATATTKTVNLNADLTRTYVVTFTVWTLTPYGWDSESAHTVQILCP